MGVIYSMYTYSSV